jgi:hypothetical protein
MRLLAVLTLLIALAAAGTARADGGVYVALGDSYTSGPLDPEPARRPDRLRALGPQLSVARARRSRSPRSST